MYHILVMVPVIIIIYVTGVEVNKEGFLLFTKTVI